MAVTAILFPGQGSQTPEMRDTVAEVRPELLSLAGQTVGDDPFHGPSKAPSSRTLRALDLPVTRAFHSPMMAEAVPSFIAAQEGVVVKAPERVTVFSAVLTGLVKRTLRDLELVDA